MIKYCALLVYFPFGVNLIFFVEVVYTFTGLFIELSQKIQT